MAEKVTVSTSLPVHVAEQVDALAKQEYGGVRAQVLALMVEFCLKHFDLYKEPHPELPWMNIGARTSYGPRPMRLEAGYGRVASITLVYGKTTPLTLKEDGEVVAEIPVDAHPFSYAMHMATSHVLKRWPDLAPDSKPALGLWTADLEPAQKAA